MQVFGVMVTVVSLVPSKEEGAYLWTVLLSFYPALLSPRPYTLLSSISRISTRLPLRLFAHAFALQLPSPPSSCFSRLFMFPIFPLHNSLLLGLLSYFLLAKSPNLV